MPADGDDPLARLQALLDEHHVALQVAARDVAPLDGAARAHHPHVGALRVLQHGRGRDRRTHHALPGRERDGDGAARLELALRVREERVGHHRVRQLVRRVFHVLDLPVLAEGAAVREREHDLALLDEAALAAVEQVEVFAVGDREAHADRLHLDKRHERARGRGHVVAARERGGADLAGDRRGDAAVLEVVARHREVRVRRRERRAGAVARGERVVHRVLRHGARLHELQVAGIAQLGVAGGRLALRHLRLGVLHGGLVLHGVEAVEEVARLHERAVLERHLKDLAGDLRHHVDLRDRHHAARIRPLLEVRHLADLRDGQLDRLRAHRRHKAARARKDNSDPRFHSMAPLSFFCLIAIFPCRILYQTTPSDSTLPAL